MAESGGVHPVGRSVLPSSFRFLLTAWFCSLTGDGLRLVALPLMATALSRTPSSVAVVAAVTALPWLIVAIPAGVIVDRLNAVRVIQAAHLIRALGCATIFVAIRGEWVSIGLLCAFGFVMTSAETFADGAAQRLLIQLIPDAGLEKANGRFVMVETVALDLAGPLIGGVTYSIGPAVPFAVSAVAFVVAAVAISPVHRSLPEKSADDHRGPVLAAMITEISDGLRQIGRDRVLRILVITVGMLSIANAAQDGMLVVYATESLGLREGLFATLLIAMSVGVLVSGLLASRLSSWLRPGTVMVGCIALMGVALLVLGLWVAAPVAWVCCAMLGVSTGLWNVFSASRRQRRTPSAMTARVSSAFRVLTWGLGPVGALAGGQVATHVSVPAVFVSSGVLVLVVGGLVARHFTSDTNERAFTS